MQLIPETKIKCGISEGCLKAITSKAGLCAHKIQDDEDYGVDYSIRILQKIRNKFSPGPIVFEAQLKSSVDWDIQDGLINYKLRVKNYNDIVQRNISNTTRILLFLMCLNKNPENWCDISPRSIIFQNSIFWLQITDSVISNLDPESNIPIHIPISQVLTTDALKSLISLYSPI